MSSSYKPEFESNYNYYEKIAKFASVVIISFFAIMIFLWPSEDTAPLKSNTETQRTEQKKSGLKPKFLIVTAPVYEGFDNSGHEYKISAETAQQTETSEVQMHLVHAEFYNGSGSKMTLEAEDGVLDRTTDQIILTGNVTLIDAEESTLTTQKANIDFKNGIATSDDNVEVIKKSSIINANGFTFNQKQNKLLFKGSVKTRINS